jgi:GNAT superfamily N-acetyltransferase
MNTQNSLTQSAPISGVMFRELQQAADFHQIADLYNRSALVDGKLYGVTVAQLRAIHAMLANSDLQTKLVLAEVDGEVIGYGRVWWEQTATGQRLYGQQGLVAPEWRHKGIGRALLCWLQAQERTGTQADAQQPSRGQAKQRCYPPFSVISAQPRNNHKLSRQLA